MAKYVRKTRNEWVMLSSYDGGKTWEEETSENTWKEMKAQLKTYRENAPQGMYKAKLVRVKLTADEYAAALAA
jgi:hypothetical protein